MNSEERQILQELLDLQKIHSPPGILYQRMERMKAIASLEAKKEVEAIYHLTESHSPGLRMKAALRFEKIIANAPQTSLSLGKQFVELPCTNTPMQENIDKMLNMVKEMPKEWTIVQITPGFNTEENLELNPKKFYTNPLNISVFNCGQEKIKPFTVQVDAPKDKVSGVYIDLMGEMKNIIESNKNVLSAVAKSAPKQKREFKSQIERYEYCHSRSLVDSRLEKLVECLQNYWLKEWRCLLAGKFVREEAENEIRSQLNNYIKKEYPLINISSRTKTLLTYITKACVHLKLTEIRSALKYCFPQKEHETMVNTLACYITNMSTKVKCNMYKKHPVLLIVDDSLDCFPWEMVDILIDESVSRLPSLHFAYALYKEYQQNIKKGQLVIEDYNTGTYIVNPDLDLENMEIRMMNFIKYWLPDWKGINGRKPTQQEFEDMLTKGNIFSYNGHGSGSQFLPMDKIQRIHVKAVVLLFGCGSTRITSIGPQAETYGTYQMYLIACSPCVVGMLWEVTDTDTDVLTTEFMSNWIPSDVDIHWRHVDKTKWRRAENVEFAKLKQTGGIKKHYNEPELLKALSLSKQICSHYVTKAACVARGLPVRIKSW